MLSRLLNLFRAGPLDVKYQGAAFRLYHQGSATERGALLNPDYNIEELRFLRAHVADRGVFVDVGAVVIEHLSKEEWQADCIADMLARGYAVAGKTRSNTMLILGS